MSPARAQRITEMISQGIESGQKFTLDDMHMMQEDVTDVFARKQVQFMISAAESVHSELTAEEKNDVT